METIEGKMVRIEGEREWMKTVIIVCTNQEEMKSASEWVCVCVCECKMRECVCKQSAQQLVQTIQWTLFSEIQISFYFLCCCKSGVTCESVCGAKRTNSFVREETKRKRYKGCLIGQLEYVYPRHHTFARHAHAIPLWYVCYRQTYIHNGSIDGGGTVSAFLCLIIASSCEPICPRPARKKSGRDEATDKKKLLDSTA